MKRLFNFYSFLFNFRLSKNSFRRGKIYFDRKWKNRYKSIFERGIKNEYLFLPPSQKKTYFDVTTRQHREFFNNKLQHSCSPLYTHIATNQRVTSSVYSSLFSLFLSFTPSTNSPLNINPSEKLLSPFTVRAGRNRALSETGYRPPLPSMPFNFRFLFPPPPKKTTLSFRPQGNKLFQIIMVVVVVVASSFHSIRGTRK